MIKIYIANEHIEWNCPLTFQCVQCKFEWLKAINWFCSFTGCNAPYIVGSFNIIERDGW